MNHDTLRRKNRRLLTIVMIVVVGMIGMSFAAVPLYRAFCQLTGFGGTTMLAEKAPAQEDILDRKVRIKFNTDVGRNLLWEFEADRRQLDIQLGQQGIMSFTAHNVARKPLSAVAIYNVTPPKAGKYFHKLACFCFGEQTLNPGETATYPVVFFIDPAMDKDPNMDDVTHITLSYTYYLADTPELERAMEEFDVEIPDPATSGTVALPVEKQ